MCAVGTPRAVGATVCTTVCGAVAWKAEPRRHTFPSSLAAHSQPTRSRHSQPTRSPLAAVTRPVTRPVTRTLRHSHAPSIVKSDEQAGENVFMKGATLSACDRVSAKPIRLVSFELVGPG